MRTTLKTSLGLAAALACCAAQAASTTTNLTVSATVSSTCSLSTSSVDFGTYNPASGSANDATGSVGVTCTSGATYSIALDAGLNASGSFTNRRMRVGSTSNYLGYQLYLDSGRTSIWGDGTGSTSVNPTSGTSTGNGSLQSFTVYGRIPAGSYVASGSYADTVTVTLTYN